MVELNYYVIQCYSEYILLNSEKKGIDAARIRLFLWTLIPIWQLIDGICIFKGIYTDGKNMPTGFKYF